ncbi:MAG: hypothetical protein K9N07_05905 [Candidatus Cloacimonetes bacterium]|nr:hypothetical protein [Candidatus Cloacimonadota bacterium]
MNSRFLQWIGYAASLIIAGSMTLSSLMKFRWVNLVGALTFSMYGFLINALPVGFLNGFIVLVDVYYLIKFYSTQETFDTLEIRADNKYLLRFLEAHDKEIKKFFPDFTYQPEMNTISFFVLRDATVAGLFLAHREKDDILKVGLDYVIPEYRDFKNGKYIYLRLRNRFIKYGFKIIKVSGTNKSYITYLKKLGFHEDKNGMYTIELE